VGPHPRASISRAQSLSRARVSRRNPPRRSAPPQLSSSPSSARRARAGPSRAADETRVARQRNERRRSRAGSRYGGSSRWSSRPGSGKVRLQSGPSVDHGPRSASRAGPDAPCRLREQCRASSRVLCSAPRGECPPGQPRSRYAPPCAASARWPTRPRPILGCLGHPPRGSTWARRAVLLPSRAAMISAGSDAVGAGSTPALHPGTPRPSQRQVSTRAKRRFSPPVSAMAPAPRQLCAPGYVWGPITHFGAVGRSVGGRARAIWARNVSRWTPL